MIGLQSSAGAAVGSRAAELENRRGRNRGAQPGAGKVIAKTAMSVLVDGPIPVVLLRC